MLDELTIAGLGVIDAATIEPHSGFTVVTGETGAGKTMIVTALGLITGGRADVGRVRTGAGRAVVEARLRVPTGSSTAELVRAAGGDLDEGTDHTETVIAVRTVGADGRSRAHLGGRAAPVATLAEATGPLITIHGQAEAMTLLRPAEQRAVLDRYAALGEVVETYRSERAAWQEAVAQVVQRTANARERAQREHLLRLGLAEIEQVAPQPGEDDRLIAEVRRLENVDALRAAATAALAAMSGAEALSDAPNALELIDVARRQLASAGDPRLDEWDGPLHQVSSVLNDVAADVAGYLGALDADPRRLEQLLERQAALRVLTRRYGADVDAVLAWAEDARGELVDLDTSDEAIAALTARRDELAAVLASTAIDLSRRRSEAAVVLGAAATSELEHLAMGRATIRIAVTRRAAQPDAADALRCGGDWLISGADGVDQVEMLLTAHGGAPELPLGRGASGGELSRVMLALEVVLAGADPVDTLVFDEVDAGVGGRAATEIGRRLAMLAADHQVIVVTHLAQVAAFADRQFVVDGATEDASANGGIRSADVREVTGEARRVELARMLGGTDGASALAHAGDLLSAASHS